MRRIKCSTDLLGRIAKHEAITSVGVSAVRGQRKGTRKTIIGFLEHLHLGSIPASNVTFERWLDARTARLCRTRRDGQIPWGVGRKCLNLFLRACCYNYHLRAAFPALRVVERWLEVPLDTLVALALKQAFRRSDLPKWSRLRDLNRKDHQHFQRYASVWAEQHGLGARVFVDHCLWLDNR
jgi:hypothetical protein